MKSKKIVRDTIIRVLILGCTYTITSGFITFTRDIFTII